MDVADLFERAHIQHIAGAPNEIFRSLVAEPLDAVQIGRHTHGQPLHSINAVFLQLFELFRFDGLEFGKFHNEDLYRQLPNT